MDVHSEFEAIKKAYARVLPRWEKTHKETGRLHFDPYFHEWKFSKIEHNVWGDIRAVGIPLYPQFPAERFFLDFANPFLKIGIECDGKEFHDATKDAKRDAILAEAGWMIFRMPGHECVRERDIASIDNFDTGEARRLIHEFHLSTSEGLLWALKWAYFGGDKPWPCEDYLLWGALSTHITTPWRTPERVRHVPSTPTRSSETIGDHLSDILRRAGREPE